MDSVLVKKAIAGDSEALSTLIDKYKDNAYNLAISIVKDKESAKDITQDSFLKVLENINRFKNNQSSQLGCIELFITNHYSTSKRFKRYP